MPVNHFGPFTIEEELELRVETLSKEIAHATEKREEAKRTLEYSQAEIDRLTALRDDYIRLRTEFDRDLARAKKRSHN
jgi:hypothetical protein